MSQNSHLIGQLYLKERLGKALDELPGHAFAFVGPKGIGKHSFAKDFAKGLLCFEQGVLGGCGKCKSCICIQESTHPDYKEIVLQNNDKTIKTDVVRKTLCADIPMLPQISKRKVYFISADDLNEQSQNAILKTLEEPPEYSVIILTVSAAQNLLPTLMSRVIPHFLQRYTNDEIETILNRRGVSDINTLKYVSRLSDGVPGIAISLTENDVLSEQRDKLISMLFRISNVSRTELLTEYYVFFEENKSGTDDLMMIINSWIRDMMVSVVYNDKKKYINEDKNELFNKYIPKCSNIINALGNISMAVKKTVRGLELNAAYESSICNMLLQIRKELADD